MEGISKEMQENVIRSIAVSYEHYLQLRKRWGLEEEADSKKGEE